MIPTPFYVDSLLLARIRLSYRRTKNSNTHVHLLIKKNDLLANTNNCAVYLEPSTTVIKF